MRAKRSLGQNFLKSIGIVEKIADFADLMPKDHVVEIGPGKGILTKALAEKVSCVTAIEKDDMLFEELVELFADQENVLLIHGDILEYDLSNIIKSGDKLVANLPYNIATQLIIRLTDYAQLLSAVVVMVQKEVAVRICAHIEQKDYSGLSVLVSSVFDTIPGFVVSPDNFYPKPKVFSQVIKLIPKKEPVPVDDRGLFKKVVYQAFSQRRKMLRNSLMGLANMDKDRLRYIAQKACIDLDKRPQDLSPEDYYRISVSYKHLMISD
jgi:16S rRNA (adenine1518-N6/adenine1519-N6)-dimethyltransferase